MEHLPELVGPLGLITVIRHRQLGSEEEVADGILVEYPVNQDSLRVALKVDAMIAAAETVQGAAVALDPAEVGSIEGVQILRQDLKLGEQIELEILGKGAHFRGADGIEDDLEHGEKVKG